MTSQLKHWKHDETQLIIYDLIMKNNIKEHDVRSLACKIKVLNCCVQGTKKWTIGKDNVFVSVPQMALTC